jgi:Baseplate J-like protein
MPTSPYTLGTPSTDPGDTSNVISGVYAPKSKSFFLNRMIATLRSSGFKLYQFGAGSLPHRFMDAIALELANLDRQWANSVVRAIRDAGYAAVGVTRNPATFATGAAGRFTRNAPATSTETIPAGTVVSTIDGRTAVTLADLIFVTGQQVGTVGVRSEIVGVGGNYAAGELTNILSSIPYSFTNFAPIDGGKEAEGEDEVLARAQALYQGLSTSTAPAILGAIAGVVSPSLIGIRDAAIINPFLIADLNIPAGVFYVVVESGGGVAPGDLLLAIQPVVASKQAAGVASVTISCAAYVAPVVITYSFHSSDASASNIESRITAAWNDLFFDSKIEDGSGRGDVDISTLPTDLLTQVPEAIDVSITAGADGIISPPLAYRALPGAPVYYATGL